MKIVAEVGSNFKTFKDCGFSIHEAGRSKADAVKFQMYTDLELYGAPLPELKGVLPRKWVPELKSIAHEVGIEFMCTAFSCDGYSFINPLVETHKIASAEITDLKLVAHVASFNKPTYLSTGGASLGQIERAITLFDEKLLTVMFCVADYPARIIDFRHMKQLKACHCGPDGPYLGFSDHTIDVLNFPNVAREFGASVIEKHVNFCGHKSTPDAPHSLTAEEFTLMVNDLKYGTTLEQTVQYSNKNMRENWQRRQLDYGFFRPYPGLSF